MTNEQPVKKLKVGSIQVAVWENRVVDQDGQSDVLHSVSVERRYKDERGIWRSATSFRTGDLPKVVLALGKAYEFLVLDTAS